MLTISLDQQDARSSLESQHALDWLNFFLAALLMGFGPFVAVHLAEEGWTPASIGVALTTSGLAGLITQVPAGEVIDRVRSKRALVAAGTAAAALGLLMLGLRPDFASVALATVLQGAAGSILGPSVAAISLGLVGHHALAERLGRNQRFASIGGLAAAATMGAIGYLVGTRDIFVLSAACGIPLLWALSRIHGTHIHFGRSCGSPETQAANPRRASRVVLLKNHRLGVFIICLFLFQLANAALLPQVSQELVRVEGRASSLIVSAFVVLPQIIVALLAPWAGRTASTWGRRPLLVIALAAVPIRSALFAVTTDPLLLVVIQMLDGLSGATLGVLTTLVVADLTNGTGRFNLAQGLVGTLSGVGASLSTSITGIVAQNFGDTAGLLGVTLVGLLSVAVALVFMPETKPSTPPKGLGTPPQGLGVPSSPA
jgi:MFS family permease